MPTLQDKIDELTKQLEELQRRQPVEPLRIQDLIGTQIPTPIPIGGTAQQGFAPGGPQLNFTGGLTHRPNNTGAILNNALSFTFGLRKELENLKKKSKAQEKSNAGA